MTRERGRFARYALHHVAVAAYGIDVIVEHREIRPVEVLRQPPSGERHAHAGAATLAQRAGCRFDARREVIFRMTGAFAAELPKPLDVVERDRGLAQTLVFGIHRFHAAEMKHRIEQHRCVAIGQHEAIAIGPDRILRIEPQKALPDACRPTAPRPSACRGGRSWPAARHPWPRCGSCLCRDRQSSPPSAVLLFFDLCQCSLLRSVLWPRCDVNSAAGSRPFRRCGERLFLGRYRDPPYLLPGADTV